MSKAHRGVGMSEFEFKGRGTCPLCNRTGIKVIYEQEFDGKKVKTCKQCKAALSHGKLKEAVAAL